MAEESYASVSTATANTANTARRASTSTGYSPPAPGLPGLRKAATMSQTGHLRQRPTVNTASPSAETTFVDFRRQSSNYSDFSPHEVRRDLDTSADEFFNPSRPHSKELTKSPYVYIPLTLALLPAVAGMLFENGSAFLTDLILLSLAAVFLHWSVTQPWDWYHTAQQVRIVKDQIMTESVFESDSEAEPSPTLSATTALENVPEEVEKQKDTESPLSESPRPEKQWEARKRAAISELYFHEVLALTWCFVFPMLGAYLLHTIRGQLSRPSEGLVSNYNLMIFLCAAEVRPVSHLMSMIQNRALRVQRVLARNPHTEQSVTHEQFETLLGRLDELEAHSSSQQPTVNGSAQPDVSQKVIATAVGREVRSTIQPELDAMNRAMRRYEKKMTVLACQTDNRIEYVECRLNDAIALAAVAAKNSNAQWGLTTWMMETTVTVVMLPVQAVMAVFTFPLRTATALFTPKSRPDKAQRNARNGKLPAQGRNSTDRVPTRVARR
ncbi:Uu.00g059690.m01.CDS01 [Anthostomella pinea]|uniref:Uu.00g059690.m01.CDS01 n=1 Tax=Anthostomella pinea TaxID=933095 RepID=A0AAI8YME9_9PEZI|nr:Uu.00g059690.m01.CDS01 [Anthostomella pinea]